MNTRTLSSAITALFLILFLGNATGQTIAVGHISAEVVEAVSASSDVATNFDLSYSTNGINSLGVNNSAMIAENVSLGSIHISAGKNIACNLTVKTANLTDEKGNGFSMQPIASFAGKSDSQQVEGSQTIELAGLAMLNSNQASGMYQGSYTLVFAYN